MKIIDVDSYLDGGTIVITTDEGEFAIDRRFEYETTNYLLFDGYPKDDNSNQIESYSVLLKVLREDLLNCLKEQQESISNYFNEGTIKWLIETNLGLDELKNNYDEI